MIVASLKQAFGYVNGGWLWSPYEEQLAQREALAYAAITDDMVAILRKGSATLHDLSNAYGPYAMAVSTLEAKGMLTEEYRVLDGGIDCWITQYAVTDAGRAELERQRKADLAKIGVYEVAKGR